MNKTNIGRPWEWSVAQVAGAPVSIHASSLGMILLAWGFSFHHTIAVLLAGFASILVLMAAHEIGHAVVARSFGLHVTRMRLLFWHGRCEYEAPQTRAQAIMIAWGGVGAQFVLFVLSFVIAAVTRQLHLNLPLFISQMLFVFGGFNLLMIVLNLIPMQPFDGFLAWQFVPDMIAKAGRARSVNSSLRKMARKSHSSLVRGTDDDK